MKKFMVLVLALVIALCAMAPSFAEEAKEVITIGFYGGGTEMDAKVQVFDLVAEKFNVELDYWYVQGADYPTKLTTVLSSGNVPDIMNMANDVFFPFKDCGYLENLKPYMEKDDLLEGVWTDSALAQYTYGDVIYAAPTVTKTFVMAYNKTLFDEAKVAYPEDGWTVDEFVEKAAALTSGEGVDKVFGFDFGWGLGENSRNLYKNPVYDVSTMSMDVLENAEFRATMEMLKTMYDNGSLLYGASTDASFTTGTVAISWAWAVDVTSGNLENAIGGNFEWDVVSMPVHPEFGQMQCTARTDGWMMSNQAENKDLVWDIIKFMTTSPECAQIYSKDGFPTLISELEGRTYVADVSKDKNIEAIINQVGNSVTFETAGLWGEINDEISYNFETYLYGDITIDEALEYMDEFGTDRLAMAK